MWAHHRSVQYHIHTEIQTGFSVLYGVMWRHFASSFILSSTKTSFKQWVYTHQELLADSFKPAFKTVRWTVSRPGTASIPLTQFVLNIFIFFLWWAFVTVFLMLILIFLSAWNTLWLPVVHAYFELLSSSSYPLMDKNSLPLTKRIFITVLQSSGLACLF